MLRALAHPLSLLVLVASFLVGVTLHGWVQSLVASRLGDGRPRSHGRTTAHPARHVDPFGTLAALLAGLGWAKPVALPAPRRRAAVLAVALAGPVANLALGVGLLLAWGSAYGGHGSVSAPTGFGQQGLSLLLEQGTPMQGAVLSTSLFLFGLTQLYLGALSLIPLPPLDGGALLFALAPRSHGWRQAEYQLVERNFGLMALLALLLIPLGGGSPLLPQLLDIILAPVITAVCGG